MEHAQVANIKLLLDSHDWNELRRALTELHSADLSELIGFFRTASVVRVQFAMLAGSIRPREGPAGADRGLAGALAR